jgi:hypothetical protein
VALGVVHPSRDLFLALVEVDSAFLRRDLSQKAVNGLGVLRELGLRNGPDSRGNRLQEIEAGTSVVAFDGVGDGTQRAFIPLEAAVSSLRGCQEAIDFNRSLYDHRLAGEHLQHGPVSRNSLQGQDRRRPHHGGSRSRVRGVRDPLGQSVAVEVWPRGRAPHPGEVATDGVRFSHRRRVCMKSSASAKECKALEAPLPQVPSMVRCVVAAKTRRDGFAELEIHLGHSGSQAESGGPTPALVSPRRAPRGVSRRTRLGRCGGTTGWQRSRRGRRGR